MRTFIKDNGIFLCYIAFQLVLLGFAFQDDEKIGKVYNINTALSMHFVSLVLTSFGYSAKRVLVINYCIRPNFYRLKSGFTFFCVTCTILGVLTSVLTIGSIISPGEYLGQLLGKDSGIAQIRQESGDAGLSGVFKMLNYCPLAIYLVTASFINFCDFSQRDKTVLSRINTFALVGTIVKVMFSLDRLSILAILLVLVYTNVAIKKFNIRFIVFVVIIVFFAGFVTASRMSETGISDFLIIYCKLSIVNFQLILNSQNDLAYGFQTFLSPVLFIGEFFGFNLILPPIKDYVWNAAQYFNSYLFLDFGYFSLIVYPILGYVIKHVETMKRNGSRIFVSLYFVVMFTFATFITVPFLRGMEFWLVIILSISLSLFIKPFFLIDESVPTVGNRK